MISTFLHHLKREVAKPVIHRRFRWDLSEIGNVKWEKFRSTGSYTEEPFSAHAARIACNMWSVIQLSEKIWGSKILQITTVLDKSKSMLCYTPWNIELWGQDLTCNTFSVTYPKELEEEVAPQCSTKTVSDVWVMQEINGLIIWDCAKYSWNLDHSSTMDYGVWLWLLLKQQQLTDALYFTVMNLLK